jgi:hypothetical protein
MPRRPQASEHLPTDTERFLFRIGFESCWPMVQKIGSELSHRKKLSHWDAHCQL